MLRNIFDSGLLFTRTTMLRAGGILYRRKQEQRKCIIFYHNEQQKIIRCYLISQNYEFLLFFGNELIMLWIRSNLTELLKKRR